MVMVLPDPFRWMGRRGTPQRPNSLATPQGLDQSSKMEEVEHNRVRSKNRRVAVQLRLISGQLNEKMKIPYDWRRPDGRSLGKVASPFRPTTRKRGGERTTTLRRRDVGVDYADSCDELTGPTTHLVT